VQPEPDISAVVARVEERVRRRWPWVLAGLLGAGALGLRSETAERVNAQLLEAGATRILGEDVRVGRVEVHYFPAKIVIRDLRVLHPATGELIADVEALHRERPFTVLLATGGAYRLPLAQAIGSRFGVLAVVGASPLVEWLEGRPVGAP
jgi:hypothetical protein